MVITTDVLRTSCRGESISPFHYAFYCIASEEGDTADDYVSIVDVELYKLGLHYMYFILENIGNYSMNYEVRRTIAGTASEYPEIKGVLEPGNLHIDILERPWNRRIYVKNTTTGQNTRYRITIVATK